MKLSFTTAATALLLINSLLIVTTHGEQDCLLSGGTMDTAGFKIEAGLMMTEEATASSDEGLAAEIESAVLASLPSDGMTDSGIAVTSTVCEDRRDRRELGYFPRFDRAWFERYMAIVTGCIFCSDSTPGYRLLGGSRKLATSDCGTHLDSPGEASLEFDAPAYVDKVTLSTAAPLTLSVADGQQVTIGLSAGETEIGAADIVAISTSSGKIESVQYSLGHCPDAQAEISAEIAAIEQSVAAAIEGVIAEKPCLKEAGAKAYVQATPADGTDNECE